MSRRIVFKLKAGSNIVHKKESLFLFCDRDV